MENHSTKTAFSSGQSLVSLWPWLAVLIVLLCVGFIRYRLLDMPLERDEGEYAYAGQLMLQGIPPYKLAYNMKLPGMYGAFAMIMAVFGQSISGVHFGLLIANAATIVLIFLLARRIFDSYSAVFAAGAYAILTLQKETLALSGHATHFVALPAVGGQPGVRILGLRLLEVQQQLHADAVLRLPVE